MATLETHEDLHYLETLISYEFNDISILLEAMSHPSLAYKSNKSGSQKYINYERLEFLGDAVLNLVISRFLFLSMLQYDEGALAKTRAYLVCRDAICAAAKKCNLQNFIRMGYSEETNFGRSNLNNIENAMEALIGAIYLDGGINTAEKVVLTLWSDVINSAAENIKDYKTRLQEWAQQNKLPIPSYKIVSNTGSSHKPVFTVELSVLGYPAMHVIGNSKKHAEKLAAAKFLKEYIVND